MNLIRIQVQKQPGDNQKMTKILRFIALLCVVPFCAFAADDCFLAKENGTVLKQEGECKRAYAPESTFKIALSLIGFDSGILHKESCPTWSLPKDTDPFINVCKGDHNPRTWMRDSCAWYSRILTSKLGVEKLQDYINKFEYGNKNLSGGLNDAWLSNSLQISPQEQVNFLQKVIDRKLPISQTSYDVTHDIMYIQELPGGWKLYGKTGTGKVQDSKGAKTEMQHGWFVGYIVKGERKVVFANHIADTKKQSTFASHRARNEALIKLWNLINDLEK